MKDLLLEYEDVATAIKHVAEGRCVVMDNRNRWTVFDCTMGDGECDNFIHEAAVAIVQTFEWAPAIQHLDSLARAVGVSEVRLRQHGSDDPNNWGVEYVDAEGYVEQC